MAESLACREKSNDDKRLPVHSSGDLKSIDKSCRKSFVDESRGRPAIWENWGG
jgi:hypothetical protein